MKKQKVRSQLKKLERVLFGSRNYSKKWLFFQDWPVHLHNFRYIINQADVNDSLIKNFIQTIQEIGLSNITYLFLQLVRTMDEMAKIQRRKGKPSKENKKKYQKFDRNLPFQLPQVEQKKLRGELSSYDRFQRAVNLKEPDRVPITPLMDYFYAANNNMSAYDFVMAPFKYIFAAVRKTYKKFDGNLDMVHVPMGRLYAFFNWLPLATSGFYGELHYPDKTPSTLQFIEKGYIDLKDFKRIRKLGLRSIWKPVNIQKMCDTIVDLVNIGKYIDYWENHQHVPIYATSGVVTPLEALCYLMGIKNWSKAILKHKEEMKQMCDFLLDAIKANNYMMYSFSRVPRTYICLERVSASFISPKIFEDLVLDNLLKLVKENVKNGLTTVFHMDSNWTPFFRFFLEFPKNGKYILHIEDSDIYKAKEMLGDRFCIMGNIQTKLLRFGTKQQIIDKTKELIDGCKEGGGYMMAEGCEIAPDTPMRNLKTWIETTKTYGQY